MQRPREPEQGGARGGRVKKNLLMLGPPRSLLFVQQILKKNRPKWGRERRESIAPRTDLNADAGGIFFFSGWKRWRRDWRRESKWKVNTSKVTRRTLRQQRNQLLGTHTKFVEVWGAEERELCAPNKERTLHIPATIRVAVFFKEKKNWCGHFLKISKWNQDGRHDAAELCKQIDGPTIQTPFKASHFSLFFLSLSVGRATHFQLGEFRCRAKAKGGCPRRNTEKRHRTCPLGGSSPSAPFVKER